MGMIRSFLKKMIRKADHLTDKEGDRLDAVFSTLSHTSSTIAGDAKDFAKKTYKNLKEAAVDINEVSKEATSEIKKKAKEDFKDVKDIAEKRMVQTRDMVQDAFDKTKEEVKEIKEELQEEDPLKKSFDPPKK